MLSENSVESIAEKTAFKIYTLYHPSHHEKSKSSSNMDKVKIEKQNEVYKSITHLRMVSISRTILKIITIKICAYNLNMNGNGENFKTIFKLKKNPNLFISLNLTLAES